MLLGAKEAGVREPSLEPRAKACNRTPESIEELRPIDAVAYKRLVDACVAEPPAHDVDRDAVD